MESAFSSLLTVNKQNYLSVALSEQTCNSQIENRCSIFLLNECPLCLSVVFGLSLGPGAEAEEGPLAGASHSAALYCIRQCAV